MKRDPISPTEGEPQTVTQQPEEAPLASLYVRWRAPVMRMLRRHFGTSAGVEDGMQEVFVRVAATRKVLTPEEEQPYLRQTVRSVAARDWQNGPEVHGLQTVPYDECHEELSTLSAEGYGDTEQQAEQRQRLIRLQDAIHELPPRQCEAFVLHRIEGYTIEETADRMGIGARMVVKHLGRAVGYCETRVLFASAEQMKRLQALQGALSAEEDNDDERADPSVQGKKNMSAEPGRSLLQHLPPEQVLQLNHRAGEWYVRRQQPGWSGADERALNEWLAQDPAHREAMNGISRTWREAEQLKAMFPTAYGHARPAAAPQQASRTNRPADAAQGNAPSAQGWSRRPALASAFAVALLAVVAAGYGWHRWNNTASYAVDIATAPGELRDIDLPDGSHVALNANSRLQVRYYPRRRETVLDQGEAFFKVAADVGRPFTVDSGSSQVRVVGTAFNVRAAPPEFVVQVQEGRVEVRSRAPEAPVLAIGPGVGVAIDPASGRRRDLSVAPEAIAEWRTGQIYFKRVPLRQVADELSRYIGQPVEIDGAALQDQPVSGLLALKEPERFLMALPSVANVRVQRRAGVVG